MTVLGPRARERITQGPAPTGTKIGEMAVVESTTADFLNRKLYDQMSESRSVDIVNVERCWDQVNPGPPYLTGGDFLSAKSTLPSSTVLGSGVYRSADPHQYDGGYLQYTGGFQVTNIPWGWDDQTLFDVGLDRENTGFFPPQSSTDPEIWNKTKPRLSEGGLGIALAESRELPRLMHHAAQSFYEVWRSIGGTRYSTARIPKKAANNFIAVEFGWLPFLNDMADFYRIFQNSKKYSEQIARDNNQWVKRKRVIRHKESEEVYFDRSGGTSGWLVHPSDWMVHSMFSDARFQVIRTVITEEWSEGVFKYYRPEFDATHPSSEGAFGEVHRQLGLYGALINPSIVYKATPWTWLADWFTSIGDSVDNATAIMNDAAVCKYLYLMQRQSFHDLLKQSLTPYSGGTLQMVWPRGVLSKRRRGNISPYGLNLSWGDLNPTQLTILGALGLTRTNPGGSLRR